MNLRAYLDEAVAQIRQWEEGWGRFERHPAMAVDDQRLRETLAAYAERLQGNYPFFHPRYAGQMLKPPHPAAIVGYLAAQLINPNNHALDGGPPTAAMEKEVVQALADMFGLPGDTLGHLTSSGTIANLEALWVARELHPDRAVAFSREAHYTHSRMSRVLRLDAVELPADEEGRLPLDALEEALLQGTIGTVVVTAGTTGLGAVDPIADVLDVCRRHGVRVHIDAAYGGFFALLAGDDISEALLTEDTRRHIRAIARCDSVVIDPHKHGLQPYGCGCVLFRDPSVGRFYKHDSPYTYFTSEALHLGEISLECSRAGAAAGALWFTLQLFPLKADAGLGPILAAGRRAARHWAALLQDAERLALYVEPELDIVTFFPRTEPLTAGAIDQASQNLFARAMLDAEDPVFLSVLRVASSTLAARHAVPVDQPQARIIRSVLMKPEHETHVPYLHQCLERFVKDPTPLDT